MPFYAISFISPIYILLIWDRYGEVMQAIDDFIYMIWGIPPPQAIYIMHALLTFIKFHLRFITMMLFVLETEDESEGQFRRNYQLSGRYAFIVYRGAYLLAAAFVSSREISSISNWLLHISRDVWWVIISMAGINSELNYHYFPCQEIGAFWACRQICRDARRFMQIAGRLGANEDVTGLRRKRCFILCVSFHRRLIRKIFHWDLIIEFALLPSPRRVRHILATDDYIWFRPGPASFR